MRCPSRSSEETRSAAHRLGEVLRSDAGAGALVALVGPLGAGKTEFVRGLAEGAGADPRLVSSPTFVVATEYPAPHPDGPAGRLLRVAHIDCYRLESEAELEETGFLDLLAPDVIVAVEWADRFSEALPADHLEVQISRLPGGDADSRDLVALSKGPRSQRWCREWQALLAAAPGAP